MGYRATLGHETFTFADLRELLVLLLAASGWNFIMDVPGADDVMLNNRSTSFQGALFLRRLLGLKPASEFDAWLLREALRRRIAGIALKDESQTELLR